MTLDRLSEVCGCFTLNDVRWNDGCLHPKSPNGQCLGSECPMAFVDYPPDASYDEIEEFNNQYSGEMDMVLNADGKHFGTGGAIDTFWQREVRRLHQ